MASSLSGTDFSEHNHFIPTLDVLLDKGNYPFHFFNLESKSGAWTHPNEPPSQPLQEQAHKSRCIPWVCCSPGTKGPKTVNTGWSIGAQSMNTDDYMLRGERLNKTFERKILRGNTGRSAWIFPYLPT